MNRETSLERLGSEHFDVLVIGGGATGLGAAVDAAARGYRTALIERGDFAGGTSSRSTKLIHGGVRYLRQGNIGLVREALHERTILARNAPQLVDEMRFLVPAYGIADLAMYSAALRAYDVLAGRSPFARSRMISDRTARTRIPSLKTERMRAAMLYSDLQFQDAAFAMALARTADHLGAAIANYVRADGFVVRDGRVSGAVATDVERSERFMISAACVINAGGIFADEIARMDDPHAVPMLTFSRGSHAVLPSSALGEGATALLIPRTKDGRVLFAIPWNDRTLVGTTDVPSAQPEIDPRATDEEVHEILSTLNTYLRDPVSESDILSTWAGLRPLVRRNARTTAALSREHVVHVSRTGLVSIVGGKWTTYRRMAQDAVTAAAAQGGLKRAPCRTEALPLQSFETPLLASLQERVALAAREEMARTVEDVLARRTGSLFADAKGARDQAAPVACALAHALGKNRTWETEQVRAFNRLASRYRGVA